VIYGAEYTAKTTLALKAAAETLRQGGSVAYVDFDLGFSSEYASQLGVAIESERFTLYQPTTLETGIKCIYGVVLADVDLVVLDAPQSAPPKGEWSKNLEGMLRRSHGLWAGFLPQLKVALTRGKTASLTLCVTDHRVPQPASYWRYYASVMVEVSKVKPPPQGEGVQVLALLRKCAVSANQGHSIQLSV
tara:strand:- start:312 stop:881 length:570 start_codon:yes stop_codon:yes gene_type:complete